ncbi:MAG: ABC transporter permease [Planctomycetota bacterium]
MNHAFESLGEFVLYSCRVLSRAMSGRGGSTRSLVEQMHRVGVESLVVVILCAFSIGLVMVLQSAHLLARYGAKAQVATLMSAAFVREIGPVFTAIMFSGRVGTGIAAEIGSMVVTEQVDAYRSFGTDPIGHLAAPRVLASFIMLPALTVVADVVGIFSGFLMGLVQIDVPGHIYIDNSLSALRGLDVISSVTKGAVFGLVVGLVATFIGLRTRRATEAVGESTTRTMVVCVLAVLLVDVLLTKIFLSFGD